MKKLFLTFYGRCLILADREIDLLFFTNRKSKSLNITLQYTNANLPGLTPVGPPMWQAEADTASLSTAVGELALQYGALFGRTQYFFTLSIE